MATILYRIKFKRYRTLITQQGVVPGGIQNRDRITRWRWKRAYNKFVYGTYGRPYNHIEIWRD